MMHRSADDLRRFYASEIGQIVQSTLSRQIADFWPETRNMRVLGCGYTTPYLKPFLENSERVLAMNSFDENTHAWPHDSKNLLFSSENLKMPIEHASVDRVLIVHHLEYSANLLGQMREIWRVLKPNGRVLIIVPNRMGAWAHADWSPLGHGTPFTFTQLNTCLKDGMFSIENHTGALFMPPIPDSPVVMNSASMFEKLGHSILPFVAGVHIVEASKQIYASIDKTGTGSAVLNKTKEILGANGKAVPQSFQENLKCQEGCSDQRRS